MAKYGAERLFWSVNILALSLVVGLTGNTYAQQETAEQHKNALHQLNQVVANHFLSGMNTSGQVILITQVEAQNTDFENANSKVTMER